MTWKLLLLLPFSVMVCPGCSSQNDRPPAQELSSNHSSDKNIEQKPIVTDQVARDEPRQSNASKEKGAFPAFNDVTRIVIREHSSEVQTITDLKAVRQIVDFMNKRLKGWDVPWYGVPVPAWDVEVYSGKTFLGHFGAGKNFFETHREGGFYTKSASKNEVLEFYRLIGAK